MILFSHFKAPWRLPLDSDSPEFCTHRFARNDGAIEVLLQVKRMFPEAAAFCDAEIARYARSTEHYINVWQEKAPPVCTDEAH